MSKVQSLGIYHTIMGPWLAFPCGCKDDEQADEIKKLTKNRQKASRAVAQNGKYPKPVWVWFETDYIFEDRPQLVEIED